MGLKWLVRGANGFIGDTAQPAAGKAKTRAPTAYRPFLATSQMRFVEILFAEGRKPQRRLRWDDFLSSDLMYSSSH